MALIGIPNRNCIGIPPKAQRIVDWCEEHIGPHDEGWYWVSSYGNSLIIRIFNDEDAAHFKLVFEDDCK